MFRRKNISKGTKGLGSAKAKKAVKRLLDKPTHDRMSEIVDLAMRENLQPFRASLGSEVGDAGVCAAVAKAMEMCPDDRLMQKEGCRAIEALADGDERNVERLGEANCCQLVEMALKKFPDDASLQTQGCRAVTNLFNGDANMKQFGRGKACELVTAALRKFPRDHEVQIEACGAVANLANNVKENRIMLGSIGACELVAECLGVFPDNIDVQHAACVAVGNLANRNAENKCRLGAAGACNKVCAALAGFQNDPGVQYMACGAVGNLSHSNPQNCTRLGEAGGCVLITVGMNTFPDDRNMQHVGCAAVANLAIGNAANAYRLIKAGARLAVQRAMERFNEDLDIQTRGSQALQWLTIRPSHRASHSQKHLMRSEDQQEKAEVGTSIKEELARDKEKGGHRRATSVPDVRMKARGDAEQPDPSVTDTDATACGGDEGMSEDDEDENDGDDDMSQDDEEEKEEEDDDDEDYTSTDGDESDSESSATESEEYSEEVDDDSCSASGMSSVGPRRRSSKPKTVGAKAGKRSATQSPSTAPPSSMPTSTRSSTPPTSALSSVPTSTSTISTSTSMPTASTTKTTTTAVPASSSTPMPSSASMPNPSSTSTSTSAASEPTANRPPSKAELPMGPLLEDFDSDGNGDYCSAPNVSKSSSVPTVRRADAPDAGKAVAPGKSARPAKSVEIAGGGRVAVGPSPPGVQAPTPGVLTSGGDPAAPQDKSSRPLGPITSSSTSPSAGTTSARGCEVSPQRQISGSYRVAAGGDPAKKAHEKGSGRDRVPGGRADAKPSLPAASSPGKPNRTVDEDAAKHRERRRSSPSGQGVAGGVGVARGSTGGTSSAGPGHIRRGSTGGRAGADVGGGGTGTPSSSGVNSSRNGVNRQREGGDAGVSGKEVSNRGAGGGRDGRAGSRAGLVPGEEDREQRHRGSSTSIIVPATSRDGRRRGNAEQRHDATVVQHPHASSASEERPRKPKSPSALAYQQQQQQQQPLSSNTNQVSFVSGRSSRSGRRQQKTASELLREPAMAFTPEVSKLLRRCGDEISSPLTTVIGRDPALLPGMVANVEKMLRRSTEMETLTQKARVKVMTSEGSPVSDSLRRREYFDTLFRGVCGGHIAAAVVANGGIMADSKDGWLRKASALVKVVSKTCPTVRDGMGLLGRALQESDRAKMADYLEQVAKASRSPSDVSALVETTALRLLEEGRAEADAASVDALQASETLSEEWLPVWLLEEAGMRGRNNHGRRDIADSFMFGGLPGTESARKAALADGCCIMKAVGRRNLRNMVTVEDKRDVLVREVQRATAKAAAPAASISEAAKAARGTTRGTSQPASAAIMMPTPMPPSVASTVHYPPASPSTLPPGQGVAPSPTDSGIGTIRRAEANGKARVDGGQGEAWVEEARSGAFPRAAAMAESSGRYARVADGGNVNGEHRRASANAYVNDDVEPSRSSERRSSEPAALDGRDKNATAAAPGVDTVKSWRRTGSWYEPRKHPTPTGAAAAARGFEQELEQDRDSLEGIDDKEAVGKPRATGIGEVEGLGKVDVDESLSMAETYFNRKRKKMQRGRESARADETEESAAATGGIASDAATAASAKANGVGESGASGLGNGGESSAWDAAGRSSGGLQDLVETNPPREGKAKGGNKIADRLALLVRNAVPGMNSGGGVVAVSTVGNVEVDKRATPDGDGNRSRIAHRRRPSYRRSVSRSRSRSVAPQEARARPSSSPPDHAPVADQAPAVSNRSRSRSAAPREARARPSIPPPGHTSVAGQGPAVTNKSRSRSVPPQEARARSSSPPPGHAPVAGQALAVRNKSRSRSVAPEWPSSPPPGHAPVTGQALAVSNKSRSRSVAPEEARARSSSPPPGHAPMTSQASAVSNKSRSRSLAPQEAQAWPSSPPPGHAPVAGHAPVVNRSRSRPGASQGARGRPSSPPPGHPPVVGHAPAANRSSSRSVASQEERRRPSSPPPGHAPVTGRTPVAEPKEEVVWQQRRGSEKDTRDLSRRGGGNGCSPASSKVSTGSRLSNFFSGSNKSKQSAEEAARDSFGSSDGTDTAEAPFGNGRGHRRRCSKSSSSSSSLALSKEAYSVAPKEGSSVAPRPTHRRSSSKASVGETGKEADRVGGNHVSSGSPA